MYLQIFLLTAVLYRAGSSSGSSGQRSRRKRRRLEDLGHPVCAHCRLLRPEALARVCDRGHHLHPACVCSWIEASRTACSECRLQKEHFRANPEAFNGSCLRGVALRMPEAVRAGASLQMVCDYDLEGAPLYSVKFYQGDSEFYRFVPKESPPTRVFPLPGVDAVVDISMSNSTVVTLNKVQKNLTGFYGCEVSADAPLFHTIIKSAPVIVIEEPEALPEVTVEKPKYSLGDRIRANCTSKGGYPPANLTWYVNGKQVKNWADMDTKFEPGLAEIELEAKSILFRDGKLRLRCLATQFSLYRRSAEVDLQEDTPQLAHVKGPTTPLPVLESSSSAAKTLIMIWMYIGIALLRWAVPR